MFIAGASIIVAAGPATAAPDQRGPVNQLASRYRDPQRDGLYQLVGVDQIPADYVVAVDVSAEVPADAAGAMAQGVRTLAATLGPKDHLTVVTFADTASVEPGPAGPPGGPAGAGRDLGAAIERAVEQLGRPGAGPVGAVVLFTAGRHAPPAGSRYPQASGPSWDALRGRAAALPQPTLYPFAVSLRDGTDAALLGHVFSGAQSVAAGSAEQLPAVFDRARQAVLAAKARRLLGAETEHRIKTSWPPMGQLRPGVRRTTLTLRNDAYLLPLTVTDLAAPAEDPRLRVSVPPGPYTVAPGKSVEIPVTVDWEPGTRGFLPYDKVRARGQVRLTARVSSVYDNALRADLGEDVHWALTGNAANVGGAVQLGRPVPWSIALAIAALVGLLLGVRRFRSRPRRATATADPAREDAPVG